MAKVTLHFLLFCFLWVFPSGLLAWDRAEPSVEITHNVYGDLDRLASWGLLSGYIVGQRPYTRGEVAGFLQEAQESLEDQSHKHEGAIQVLLDRYKQEFLRREDKKQNIEIQFLNHITTELTFLQANRQAFPTANPLDIGADYQPFVNNRGGWHYAKGVQSFLHTEHVAYVTPHMAFYVQPRFQLQWQNREAGREHQIFIDQAYVSFTWRNTQIDVGRKPMHWGQSRLGGLMYSHNARSLDQVQVFNPTAWSWGKALDFKYTFFLGTLGPEQNRRYPFMSGAKVSFLLWSSLELGLARSIIFNGTGAPDLGVVTYFREFVGWRNQSEFGGAGGPNPSNSITGAELRFQPPFMKNLSLYTEFYFDDFAIRRFLKSIQNSSVALIGVYMPRVDHTGTLSLRLEARKNSAIMYKHGEWTTGWVMNRLIMGDPLGPDAESLYLGIKKSFLDGRTRFFYESFVERTDSDVYSFLGQSDRVVSFDGVSQWRFRNIVHWMQEWNSLIKTSVGLGYEYATNFDFTVSNPKHHFYASFQLTWDFGRRYHLSSK